MTGLEAVRYLQEHPENVELIHKSGFRVKRIGNAINFKGTMGAWVTTPILGTKEFFIKNKDEFKVDEDTRVPLYPGYLAKKLKAFGPNEANMRKFIPALVEYLEEKHGL